MNRVTPGFPPTNREALATTSLILTVVALFDIASRSVLRATVDLYWHQNIFRYNCVLLKWIAIVYGCLAVLCFGARLLTAKDTRADARLLRQSLILLLASDGGFIIAALCQAMFHLAGLSGPTGGELHPRSLTLASSVVGAIGLALLIRSLQGAGRVRA